MSGYEASDCKNCGSCGEVWDMEGNGYTVKKTSERIPNVVLNDVCEARNARRRLKESEKGSKSIRRCDSCGSMVEVVKR